MRSPYPLRPAGRTRLLYNSLETSGYSREQVRITSASGTTRSVIAIQPGIDPAEVAAALRAISWDGLDVKAPVWTDPRAVTTVIVDRATRLSGLHDDE